MLQCGANSPPLGVGCYLFDAPGGAVVKSWDFVPTLLGSRIAFSPCGPQPCQKHRGHGSIEDSAHRPECKFCA